MCASPEVAAFGLVLGEGGSGAVLVVRAVVLAELVQEVGTDGAGALRDEGIVGDPVFVVELVEQSQASAGTERLGHGDDPGRLERLVERILEEKRSLRLQVDSAEKAWARAEVAHAALAWATDPDSVFPGEGS